MGTGYCCDILEVCTVRVVLDFGHFRVTFSALDRGTSRCQRPWSTPGARELTVERTLLLCHGRVASAHKFPSFSTTCAVDETGCLKLLHQPFVFLTRIGRKAETHATAGFQDPSQLAQSSDASGQTCMELTAIALSKALLSNGKLAAVPRCNSTRALATVGAFRAWACAIISGDGSTPAK